MVHVYYTEALDGGSPMSHVEFNKLPNSPVSIYALAMSILTWVNVACRIEEMAHVMSLIFFPMSIGFMSHVDFKKGPCCPVKFKGQGPLYYITSVDTRSVTYTYSGVGGRLGSICTRQCCIFKRPHSYGGGGGGYWLCAILFRIKWVPCYVRKIDRIWVN